MITAGSSTKDAARRVVQRVRGWRLAASNALRTLPHVLAHMRACSEFYRRIKAGGYRSQPELGLSPYVGEIECAVAREGRLLKINAGNHRLAVARLLGVRSIPVHVATLYDSLRDQFESGNALERIRRVRRYIARLKTDYGPRQEDCSPPAGRIAKT